MRRKGIRLRYLPLAAGVLVAGSWGVNHRPHLVEWLDYYAPIHRVKIEKGGEHIKETALTRQLKGIQGGFFTVDIDKVQRWLEAHPWVRQARVRREWPGILRIHLVEHRTRAVWVGEDQSWLVNQQGLRFKRFSSRQSNQALPRLRGEKTQLDRLLHRLATLRRRLHGRYPIHWLQLNSQGSWSARLGEGVTVHFGDQGWKNRLARLLRVQKRWELLGGAISRIDLRYPNGMAITLKRRESEMSRVAAGRDPATLKP